MTLKNIIEDTRESLIQEKRKLEKLLREAPVGTLIYSKNTSKGRTYYKYYVSVTDKDGLNKKIYISRKNRNFAKQLARKRLHSKRLKDIKNQLSAMDSFLAKYSQNSALKDLLNVPLLFNLLEDEELPTSDDMSEELKRWAHEEYETNPYHPEHKNVPTVDGTMVRSKSEAFIVMLLSAQHIPYRYECKLEIGGHIYYPDFTIRHPVTGKTYYWEHVGALHMPEYRSDFIQKMRIYINNGLIPDYNLILTYESEGRPFDITIAQDKLREFFSCETVPLY